LRPLNQRRVPARALTLSGIILLTGVFLNYLIPDQVFMYTLSMIAWLILLVWSLIALSHIFYRRSVPEEQWKRVTFRLPGAPYTNWLILSVIGVAAVMLALNGGSRMTFYLLLSWFGLLVAAYYGMTASKAHRKAS
jgi:AAT family amino acid transporter/D-serine/D-alanine/glycine transporter